MFNYYILANYYSFSSSKLIHIYVEIFYAASIKNIISPGCKNINRSHDYLSVVY